MKRTPAVVLECGLAFAIVAGLLRPDARAADQRHMVPTAPSEYLARVNPVASSEEILAQAESLYLHHCKKCHGADGKGRGSATRGMAVKPPDFTDTSFMTTQMDGQLVWIILNGSDPDTTEMTGFKNKMSESDAWKLVHYIRTFAGAAVVANGNANRGGDHEQK